MSDLRRKESSSLSVRSLADAVHATSMAAWSRPGPASGPRSSPGAPQSDHPSPTKVTGGTIAETDTQEATDLGLPTRAATSSSSRRSLRVEAPGTPVRRSDLDEAIANLGWAEPPPRTPRTPLPVSPSSYPSPDKLATHLSPPRTPVAQGTPLGNLFLPTQELDPPPSTQRLAPGTFGPQPATPPLPAPAPQTGPSLPASSIRRYPSYSFLHTDPLPSLPPPPRSPATQVPPDARARVLPGSPRASFAGSARSDIVEPPLSPRPPIRTSKTSTLSDQSPLSPFEPTNPAARISLAPPVPLPVATRTPRHSASSVGSTVAGRRWHFRPVSPTHGPAASVVSTTVHNVDAPTGAPSSRQEKEKSEWLQEEHMDIEGLMGRAVILERLLRSGQRASQIDLLRQRRDPAGADPPSSTAAAFPQFSDAASVHKAASRASFSFSSRRDWAQKIRRTSSREDGWTILTDLDAEGGASTGVDDKAGPSRPSLTRPRETRTQGHGGVLVFPELTRPPCAQERTGPFRPRPPVASLVSVRSVQPEIGTFYIPPREGRVAGHGIGDETQEGPRRQGWQSPVYYLGHRDADWREKQSVFHHINAGDWEALARRRWIVGICIGCSVVVVLIVVLLAVLLSRRQDAA